MLKWQIVRLSNFNSFFSMADDRDVELEHNYNDQASKFWSIYVTEAEQHDKNLTDTWKADMDSTLIFAGLFSAVITAFIIDGYKLLQPDPTNATVVLLNQILTVQIASYNHDNSSIPSLPVPIPSSPSVPEPSATAINILWFLSLGFSLVAALMMILVQQWVRHYLQRVAHHAQSLRRSRTRSLLFDGVEKWKLPRIVGYVPALLHISLFLFLSGLSVFLFQISTSVAWPFLGLVTIFVFSYSIASLTPIHDLSAPFETPLSSSLWYIYASIRHLKLRSWMTSCLKHRKLLTFWKASRPPTALPMSDLATSSDATPWDLGSDADLPRLSLDRHLAVARRQYALNPIIKNKHKSLEMDAQAFIWAFKRTIDDSELEKFAEAIPGFLSSDDGQKTWTLVHKMFSQPSANHNSVSPLFKLEERIAVLLSSIATSGNIDAGLRRRRGMACVKTLFTISLQQFTIPDREPPIPCTVPSPLTSFGPDDMLRDTFWDNEAITMALCTFALVPYRAAYLPRWEGSNQEFNVHCIKADKLLHDIEDLDQSLIDRFDEAREDLAETGKPDLSTYISALDKKSCELAVCIRYIKDHMPEEYSFDFYIYRFSQCLAFPMFRTKSLPGEVLVVSPDLLFGHQLLALMRCHGLYPSLPDRTHLIPPEEFHRWLHVDDDTVSKCDPNSPFHHLLLELQPITSLVHLIGCPSQPIHAELSVSLSPWSRPTDLDLWSEFIPSFGPFQLLASDLKDTSSHLLLTLVGYLHHHASKHANFQPDASTLHMIMDRLFPIGLYKPSAMFVAAVGLILTRERDSKQSRDKALSSLFPRDMTDYLVHVLFSETHKHPMLPIISMFRRVYGFQFKDADIKDVDIEVNSDGRLGAWWRIVDDIRNRRRDFLKARAANTGTADPLNASHALGDRV